MSTEGWPGRHKAAEKDGLGHRWFIFDTRDGFRCCASCGKCEPRDRSKLSPCKGPTRIVLRDAPTPKPRRRTRKGAK